MSKPLPSGVAPIACLSGRRSPHEVPHGAQNPSRAYGTPIAELSGPPAAAIAAGVKLAAKPPAAAAKTRPAWVDALPQVVDGAYQTSITVGPYTTRGECDAKLSDALQESLDQYVDAYLGEGIPGRIRLPSDYLCRQLVKDRWEETRQYSVGPMTRLHALLRFDRQVKERILEAYRQTRVEGRLWLTGGTVLAMLGLLATLYGYLRWSIKTPASSLS